MPSRPRPEAEYTLARSAAAELAWTECRGGSMFALSTLNGRDSRLPPKLELGARARTEAPESILRLLRFEDEAKVIMLALSAVRLLELVELNVLASP